MLTDQELIERIFRFRGKHNMTQAALAENVGIAMPTLNRIEQGKASPTALTKMKIINYMEDYENDLETNNKKD